MIRSFFAIDLPDEFTEEIQRLQEQLRRTGADVKWVRPGSVHLTLKFLGSVPRETLTPLSRAVADAMAGQGEIRLETGNLGFFPNANKPRILWLGLGGDIEALVRLQSVLEKTATPFGFEPERRAFKPHLTLGRIRTAQGVKALVKEVERIHSQTLAFTAQELTLFKSDLKSTGAVYTALDKLPLTGSQLED